MPRIDFYVLSEQTPEGRERLACRLAEKAYGLGHKVYIHAASAEHARSLDDLLWTFRQGSFVPHRLYPPESGETPPVLIGWGETSARAAELFGGLAAVSSDSQLPAMAAVLINLSTELPSAFERFERLVELVDQDPAVLAKSRELFRYYRERGYSPASHKL